MHYFSAFAGYPGGLNQTEYWAHEALALKREKPVKTDRRDLSTAAGDPELNISARFDYHIWRDGITGASVYKEGERYTP